jgi:hypothetical protein
MTADWRFWVSRSEFFVSSLTRHAGPPTGERLCPPEPHDTPGAPRVTRPAFVHHAALHRLTNPKDTFLRGRKIRQGDIALHAGCPVTQSDAVPDGYKDEERLPCKLATPRHHLR